VTAPRLFGIAATAAPVVAVLRRGPTDWCHVGRWDLDAMRYEPGSWLRGTLYPQRCDLSPDGRWLCYFTLKSGADWSAGGTYIALSRLPWLTALAAWGSGGTWTRGLHFVDDTSVWPAEAPDEGDAAPCRERYGLAFSRADSFAVERRRGWTETPESPPRAPDDVWDERRAETVVMHKPDPTRPSRRLLVQGGRAAFRELPDRYAAPAYSLVDGGDGDPRLLDDVQWADWSADGRLLVATRGGRLQCRTPDGLDVSWEQDLAGLAPDPVPPPAEARRW
jgi:hypothetical protein